MKDPHPNGWDRSNGRLPGKEEQELPDADAIQHRMAELRRELQCDAIKLTQQVQQATHLSYYVEKFPFTCAGIAMLLGYALVPSRKEVVRPSQDQLERLVKSGDLRLTAASQPAQQQSGMLSRIGLAVGAMAARAVMAYVGQQVGQFAAPVPRTMDGGATSNIEREPIG